MHGGCYTASSWGLWCCSDRGTPGHGLLWPGAHPLLTWVVLFSLLLVRSMSHSWRAVKEHPILGPQASETWVGPGLEKDPAATALPIAKCSPASLGSVSPLPREPTPGNRREGLPTTDTAAQSLQKHPGSFPGCCPGKPLCAQAAILTLVCGKLWQGWRERKGGKEGAPEFISEGPMVSLMLGFLSPPQKSSLCLSPDALTLRLS